MMNFKDWTRFLLSIQRCQLLNLYRYCHERNIENKDPDDIIDCPDTDIVMEESLLPRSLSTQVSISLMDLILSPAKIQMDTWKPNVLNIMQQFQDFDNEGYDIKNCPFNIVQNSKMQFNQRKEVFLFGLKFTEAPSASNRTIRSIENYDVTVLQ